MYFYVDAIPYSLYKRTPGENPKKRSTLSVWFGFELIQKMSQFNINFSKFKAYNFMQLEATFQFSFRTK